MYKYMTCTSTVTLHRMIALHELFRCNQGCIQNLPFGGYLKLVLWPKYPLVDISILVMEIDYVEL